MDPLSQQVVSLAAFTSELATEKEAEVKALTGKLLMRPPSINHAPHECEAHFSSAYQKMMNQKEVMFAVTMIFGFMFERTARPEGDTPERSFFYKHATSFALIQGGNCAQRAAYSALKLSEIFKDTEAKIFVKNFQAYDQYFVQIELKGRVWIFDPQMNPELLFEENYYRSSVLTYYQGKPLLLKETWDYSFEVSPLDLVEHKERIAEYADLYKETLKKFPAKVGALKSQFNGFHDTAKTFKLDKSSDKTVYTTMKAVIHSVPSMV